MDDLLKKIIEVPEELEGFGVLKYKKYDEPIEMDGKIRNVVEPLNNDQKIHFYLQGFKILESLNI